MLDIVTEKVCTKCGISKPLNEYYKKSGRKYGVRPACASCESLQTKKARKENPEVFHSREKKWRDGNKEKINARKKQWKVDNSEKVIASSHRYYLAHVEQKYLDLKNWLEKYPWKIRERNHARRARKLGNGGVITEKEFVDLCEHYNNKCLCCGRSDVKMTLDHVIPLIMGGKNTIDNAQPLCKSCNSSKGKKTIDYRK